MRNQVAALLLCLVGAPSHALTLSMPGLALAPCGDQMCVDMDGWTAEATDALAGETTMILPTPDPAVWQLSGGYFRSFPGSGYYYGWYDRAEAEQAGSFAGVAGVKHFTLGANGDLLHYGGANFPGYCQLEQPGSPVICGDYNLTSESSEYTVVPGDPAFLGPLTLSYQFDKQGLTLTPLSEDYRVGFGGDLHLVYSPVPEPNTALLLTTGLLGLAHRQRRYGRAAWRARPSPPETRR